MIVSFAKTHTLLYAPVFLLSAFHSVIENLQLNNYSTRSIPFELSWPADCVTVAPSRGVIAPRSVTKVRVAVDVDPRLKGVTLPLQSRIHITSDSSQKVRRLRQQIE